MVEEGTNMTKKSYQERVREQREQDILETAARLIHEQGYSNLNMDVLAEEVGISKSTLYQHFSSKEEMVMQVMHKGFTLLDEHMQISTGEPIEKLEAMIRYMLQKGHAPDGFSTHMVRDEVMVLFHSYAEIGARIGATFGRMNQWINEGREKGQIRKELSNTVIATTMFSMLSVLDMPAALRDTQTVDERIEQAVSIWLRGIKA
jgi:AcrR family transcriptional regulator